MLEWDSEGGSKKQKKSSRIIFFAFFAFAATHVGKKRVCVCYEKTCLMFGEDEQSFHGDLQTFESSGWFFFWSKQFEFFGSGHGAM